MPLRSFVHGDARIFARGNPMTLIFHFLHFVFIGATSYLGIWFYSPGNITQNTVCENACKLFLVSKNPLYCKKIWIMLVFFCYGIMDRYTLSKSIYLLSDIPLLLWNLALCILECLPDIVKFLEFMLCPQLNILENNDTYKEHS